MGGGGSKAKAPEPESKPPTPPVSAPTAVDDTTREEEEKKTVDTSPSEGEDTDESPGEKKRGIDQSASARVLKEKGLGRLDSSQFPWRNDEDDSESGTQTADKTADQATCAASLSDSVPAKPDTSPEPLTGPPSPIRVTETASAGKRVGGGSEADSSTREEMETAEDEMDNLLRATATKPSPRPPRRINPAAERVPLRDANIGRTPQSTGTVPAGMFPATRDEISRRATDAELNRSRRSGTAWTKAAPEPPRSNQWQARAPPATEYRSPARAEPPASERVALASIEFDEEDEALMDDILAGI